MGELFSRKLCGGKPRENCGIARRRERVIFETIFLLLLMVKTLPLYTPPIQNDFTEILTVKYYRDAALINLASRTNFSDDEEVL